MRLLFDENVSPKLAEVLAKEYPGSAHVRSVGLRGADDRLIWDYAREQGFTAYYIWVCVYGTAESIGLAGERGGTGRGDLAPTAICRRRHSRR